jgi:hypothetical protein
MKHTMRDYFGAVVLAVLLGAALVAFALIPFLIRPYDIWAFGLGALICAGLALTFLVQVAGKPTLSAFRAYWQQSRNARSSRPNVD